MAEGNPTLSRGGTLEGSPRDIGALIREIPDDILKEEGEEIKKALFEHFWPDIRQSCHTRFPEWYKQELAKQALNHDTAILPEQFAIAFVLECFGSSWLNADTVASWRQITLAFGSLVCLTSWCGAIWLERLCSHQA